MGKKAFCFCICILISIHSISHIQAQTLTTNMRMGTNFWVIGWGGGNPRSGSGWNPTFLDEIKLYGVLRFMDWQSVNNSDVVTWEQRGVRDGITYEMMVDLCNVNNSDAWFCVPHKADDNFIRQLALLCKNNLESNLKVYIEYSNEIWNSEYAWYKDYWHCIEMGNSLGIIPAGVDEMGSTAFYNAYRTVEIKKIFSEVFGAETEKRVVSIIGSFTNAQTLTTRLVQALRDPKINPDKVKVDAFAIAPYFSEGGTFTTIENAMNFVKNMRIGSHLKEVYNYNALEGATAKLVSYEGGQHYENGMTFNTNPGAYDVFIAYLDNIGRFLDLFCHYTHSGGPWGAKSTIGQPLNEAHKYRAMLDWAKANPYTETIVGITDRTSAPLAVHRPASNTGSIRYFNADGRLLSSKGTADFRILPSRIVFGQTGERILIMQENGCFATIKR